MTIETKKTTITKEIPHYTVEEWRKEAVRRFGPDAKQWKFVCPICGHVQCIQDFLDVGCKEPERYAYFSCFGRMISAEGTMTNGKSPCDYTLGGLFCLPGAMVKDEKGVDQPVFAFADAEGSST